MIIHDLVCPSGHLESDVEIRGGVRPRCPECGARRSVSWEHGRPPATDVYGQERFNHGSGTWHMSTREVEQYMKARGFQPAGDKVHGGPAMQGEEGKLPRRLGPPGRARRNPVSGIVTT